MNINRTPTDKYFSLGHARDNFKSKGQERFRYIVSGTVAELADYKHSQQNAEKGDFYIEDALKRPLFTATEDAGLSAVLHKTKAGRYIALFDEKKVAIAKLYNYATDFPLFAQGFSDRASIIASTPTKRRVYANATVVSVVKPDTTTEQTVVVEEDANFGTA